MSSENTPGKDTAGGDEHTPAWERLRRFFRRLAPGGNIDASLRESLAEVIDEHEGGSDSTLGPDERVMLMNVLRYGELRIEDVMIPRADIVAVDAALSFRGLVDVISKEAHSRLPVFKGSLDEVIGMVHVKDVVRVLAQTHKQPEAQDDTALESLMRPVLFVPPSMKLMEVLGRMRARRTHMALVVDEYGGIDGLVTIEDLVEEIVGEIEDEHDDLPVELLVEVGNGQLEADARLPVPDLEAVLKCDLLPDERDEDIETLGGLVVSLVGRVPEVGEVVDHSLGFRFEILAGDRRRLTRLKIYRPSTGEIPGEKPGEKQS